MIVIDASALVEVILSTEAARLIHPCIYAPDETLHAPHLIDLEVTQVLRRYVSIGEITELRGDVAMDDLADFPMQRYPHTSLLPRVWTLRRNVTAYDATYIALAEFLGCPLLTRDRRLAAAPGHNAQTIVV